MRKLLPFLALALLSACSGAPKRDYESSAQCNARGIAAGTPEFESCVKEERAARMLEQQRKEFERRKQQEEMWRDQRPFR